MLNFLIIILSQIAFSASYPDWVSCPDKILKDFKTDNEKSKCITADYNDDGIKDFAIHVQLPPRDPQTSAGSKVRVYFMEKSGAFKAVDIDRTFGSPPGHYISNDWHKEYGCPQSKLIGVLEPGEGGTNHIYLWNKSKNKFDHFECASESH